MVILGHLPPARAFALPRRRAVKIHETIAHKTSDTCSVSTGDRDSSNSLCSSISSAGDSISDIHTYGGRYLRGTSVERDFVVDANVLGSGMTGDVLLATRRSDGAKCALKRFNKQSLTAQERLDLQREVDVYLSLDHPHIARLEGVYETDAEVSLVMECLEGGEVFDRIRTEGRYSESEAAETLRQMLLAVEYMHQCHIVHCDLKAENFVYLDKQRTHVKLIDFGLARRWNGADRLRSGGGTLHYIAPEMIGGSFVDQADMWSMGVLAHVLLCGKTPFKKDGKETVRLICAGTPRYSRSKFPHLSMEVQGFVKSLLVKDESCRLTASAALQHAWICSSKAS